MGTRYLAAPVGRALLWNDNKSGDLIKVPVGRKIESYTSGNPEFGADLTRLDSTRLRARQIKPIKPLLRFDRDSRLGRFIGAEKYQSLPPRVVSPTNII